MLPAELILLVLHLFIWSNSLWNKIPITTVEKRHLGWRSLTNDEVKYRMRGNMFVTNQLQITFLSCYHFNVFQATLRISFKKISAWAHGYIIFRRILGLNISVETYTNRIYLARLLRFLEICLSKIFFKNLEALVTESKFTVRKILQNFFIIEISLFLSIKIDRH